MRACLAHGHTAWISAPEAFYNRLQIIERHAFRLAFRIRLPSPTAALYDRISFPTILQHLESLRTKYITKGIENGNSILLDTIHLDSNLDSPPTYTYTPLQHLMTMFSSTMDPNDPRKHDFNIYHPDHFSRHVYPSLHQ